jgi:hypothetical protein
VVAQKSFSLIIFKTVRDKIILDTNCKLFFIAAFRNISNLNKYFGSYFEVLSTDLYLGLNMTISLLNSVILKLMQS